jgi:hypothetical protein
MSSEIRTVGLIGLPNTGKTTYAVVFYQSCEAQVDDMRITRYAVGDREYLNEQANALADCKVVERTGQQQRHEVHLKVQLAATSADQELIIPDLSGEFLRDSMSSRSFSERLVALVRDCDALLLFIRPDHLKRPDKIESFNEALRELGEDPGGDSAPENPDDWEIDLGCTQARITDIIQEIVGVRTRRVRLGLVLSAWDTEAGGALTPRQWAERELPLVVSCVDNDPQVTSQIFGVSAQGHDFGKVDTESLREVPIEQRAWVCHGDGSTGGIGAPLRWALGSQ